MIEKGRYLMEKAIVFGLGASFDSIRNWLHDTYDVVALTDNDPERREERQNEGRIIEPGQMLECEFDCVVITKYIGEDAIRRQCLDIGIAPERIVSPLRSE
jgi:hypothetical protein